MNLSKILLLGFLIGFTVSSNAQYIDNFINISATYVHFSSLSQKNIDAIPSLIPNYEDNAGYELSISGKILKQGWVGLGYRKVNFTNYQKNIENPLLQDPSSFFSSLFIVLNYTKGNRIEVSPEVSFGPVFHSFNAKDIKVSTDDPNYRFPKDFNEIELGFDIGLRANYHLNNSSKLTVKANYHYMSAGHQLYLDKSFQAICFSMGMQIKLLKNKYFKYE